MLQKLDYLHRNHVPQDCLSRKADINEVIPTGERNE